ncbi:glycosyltransferase family 1 protein [Flavobacterium sufflavum]|uniref:Glycosyltransferase family 1 protein n=1 Tax=Flavobacterium sufflavum TaxID=1921138 RepID=A0A3S2U2C8_9FLAO|nr:glycosyltransferase family 4 protein [Flavobacterium sufflavum]RVT75899.1 glycosyltransferase family 1 protein [Flavobacterium sufflavum]
MHICFLTSEYPKEGFPHGGIGSFVKTMASALVNKGIKVSVIGINYIPNDETQIVDGVNIYRLKRSTVKGLAWYFNFKAINNKIDQIHRQDSIQIIESSELGLAFIKKIKNIKYIIRLHGGHHFFTEAENRGINQWKGFQEKKSFKNSDAFIAVSHYVKNHTEKYLSYHNKPLAYINNPIDTDFFKPIIGNESENKIVFVGTVCEKKGIRQLIQAFPFVKKEFPNATLEIYGRDWFFPDGSSYIAMLKEKELKPLGIIANDICFHGAVPLTTLPSKYAEAAVCVFPSHMETLGLVAPEAMAMQKPVVFTNKGPGSEIILDGQTGLLCNPYNPKDIAEKIIWVFEHKSEAKQMGLNAVKYVLKAFDIKMLIQKNIQFYLDVIHQNIEK